MRAEQVFTACTSHAKFEEWGSRFYIPEHYIRLTCSMDVAKKIARYGYLLALEKLNIEFGFTQSLVIGAFVGKFYSKVYVIMSSQAGKSYCSAACASLMAQENKEPVNIAGASGQITTNIMGYITQQLQNASHELQENFTTETLSKLERAQTGLSRTRVMINGVPVQSGTLADRASGEGNKNSALMGTPGNVIVEESGLASDVAYSEVARSDLGSYSRLEISNSHLINHLYYDVTEDPVPDDTLVIWGDIQTAIEEAVYQPIMKQYSPQEVRLGRIDWKRLFTQFKSSVGYKNPINIRRYLLSIFPEVNDEELFDVHPMIATEPPELPSKDFELFMGIDSAYKGKDAIAVSVIAFDRRDGTYTLIHSENVKEEVYKFNNSWDWVDGVTDIQVIKRIVQLAKELNVIHICLDIGQGIWINSYLNKFYPELKVTAISFGGKPCEARILAKEPSAYFAVDRRSEMYLSLKQHLYESKIKIMQEYFDDLMLELRATKDYEYKVVRGQDKFKLAPKSRTKKALQGASPDMLDAFVLALHAGDLYGIDRVKTIDLNKLIS